MRERSLDALAMFKHRTSFDGQSRYRDVELIKEHLIHTETLLIREPLPDLMETGRCNRSHFDQRAISVTEFEDILGHYLAGILEGLRTDSLLKFR